MSPVFNADEVFQIAEEIEKRGARFYRRAAENMKDEREYHLLINLAAMEDQHFDTFAAMRAELTDVVWDVDFDLDNQASAYLKAVAEGKVFDRNRDAATELTGDESVEDILRIAISLEKDSVIFYEGVKQMVPEQLGKDKIDHIIQEEMNHITELSEELSSRTSG